MFLNREFSIENSKEGNLIQVNNVARTENLWSWFISLANAKSLFKINFGHKIFICQPIYKIFAALIVTNLVPNIVQKIFCLHPN